MGDGFLYLVLTSIPVLAGVGVLSWLYQMRRTRFPLPPGPKGWPVIGNLLDLPKVKEWETYHSWSQTYGEPSLTIVFVILSDKHL
jgi:hypothetical protein